MGARVVVRGDSVVVGTTVIMGRESFLVGAGDIMVGEDCVMRACVEVGGEGLIVSGVSGILSVGDALR